MRHFRFLVMDRRQRTPALFHVETTDEARARELAAGILRRSADHEQVTIWEDGRLLATIAPQVGNPTER